MNERGAETVTAQGPSRSGDSKKLWIENGSYRGPDRRTNGPCPWHRHMEEDVKDLKGEMRKKTPLWLAIAMISYLVLATAGLWVKMGENNAPLWRKLSQIQDTLTEVKTNQRHLMQQGK